MKLEGKVAIVTGGARNIGREYCLGMAREGADVIVADIREPDQTVKEVEELGRKALGIHVDVSEADSVQNMVDETLAAFGRIDVLVNNAALYGDLQGGLLEMITPEYWDQVMAVNVKGPFLCCRAVIPVMRQQQSGSIINISSGTFWVGMAGSAHYIASKGAVIGLTRAAAREAGPANVRVNAVTPGFTMSQASLDLMAQMGGDESLANEITAGTALGRREQPEDLVGPVVFLASDASSFMTGQTVNVDGGWFMH
ncbi:MAG: 3-oxoacyl-ACP reductase family protein [Acidimicrobiales bacterium]|nr:3-oxoacyl-ACP reductase family protein [Acidimicrobiales bacterium]